MQVRSSLINALNGDDKQYTNLNMTHLLNIIYAYFEGVVGLVEPIRWKQMHYQTDLL